ncbi:MAG: hypothetical protein AAF791_09995 [Bacteroidota bacterium]
MSDRTLPRDLSRFASTLALCALVVTGVVQTPAGEASVALLLARPSRTSRRARRDGDVTRLGAEAGGAAATIALTPTACIALAAHPHAP